MHPHTHLVNNAGVLPEAAAEPADAICSGLYRETFATNLFGAVAVTKRLLPLLRRSQAALNSVTISLSKLLAGTPIKVNAVCPGWVQTDLAPGNRERAPLPASDAAEVVVRYALLEADGPSGGFFDREAAVAW